MLGSIVFCPECGERIMFRDDDMLWCPECETTYKGEELNVYPGYEIGDKVYWRDPDENATSSGVYEIIGFQGDKDMLWYEDSVIYLSDGTSDVETDLSEIMPIYNL